ncbi:glycosyltransferase family 61 protein [Palleronia rufa]|uniref:glycosyltransferase family 61 protein n=1 Tax=Palleronia rufa TaxID=1530186 RepID=UPI00055A1FD7|nr:glycosyltransferase family 61 protein [Palleronia rufa]
MTVSAGPAQAVRRRAARLCERAVLAGAPPGPFGWRWVREESVPDYAARGGAGEITAIHPPARAANPLPVNVTDPAALSDDPDWFGFSQRDVATRQSGETLLATLPDCTVASFTDAPKGRFWPTVINRDSRAFDLREMRFRPGHGAVLRGTDAPRRLTRATWITERVYDNHSHWLTAHLPKLCLLKSRDALDGLLLPARRSAAMDASLRMLDIDPAAFDTHGPEGVLRVDRLTLLVTDRFRPELLRPVRDRLARPPDRAPWRRVFISRAGARIRKLANEAEIAPLLDRAGFERVAMEDLDFGAQVRLMGETAVLMAPHGAGLTNMMFCAPGTQVVEIAEPSYPNPNFYALAAAMGLGYWKVDARFAGDPDTHRLDRDLAVDPAAVDRVLGQLAEAL